MFTAKICITHPNLASRKCPFFGCKHIAKSPAMLEKHMVRHAEEVVELPPDTTRYQCQACKSATNDHDEMIAHLKTHMAAPGKENVPTPEDEEVDVVGEDAAETLAELPPLPKPVPVLGGQVPLSFSAEFLAHLG